VGQLFQLLQLSDLYMVEQLAGLCRTALERGVFITSDNLYEIARQEDLLFGIHDVCLIWILNIEISFN
jgi:hypothetical protein